MTQQPIDYHLHGVGSRSGFVPRKSKQKLHSRKSFYASRLIVFFNGLEKEIAVNRLLKKIKGAQDVECAEQMYF